MNRDLRKVEKCLRTAYAKLEHVKSNNEHYRKLEENYKKLSELQSDYEDYVRLLKKLLLNLQTEYGEFRERRLAFLNESITDRLLKIFPERGFSAKIEYEDKRGKEMARLVLNDPLGRVRRPSMTEGDLCKYLICYAAIESVVTSLGRNIIYIDEAFGVASDVNKPKIGQLLQSSVENGMQIILVSQSKELYEEVKHREFQLEFHPETETAVLVGVVDVD